MDKQNNSHIITADELMDQQFAPRWITVDDFLPAGVFLLGGEPKIGKTRLVTQLCFCVSTGAPFLGLNTHQATVLYFSLEDTMGSLQERLIRMFGPGWDGSRLQLATTTGDPGVHILCTIEDFLQSHPDTRLIVIDPLQIIRTSAAAPNSYPDDYSFVKLFKAFTDRRNLTLLIVHHTRKPKGDVIENPFDELLGTRGLRGAADGSFVVYSQKGEILLAQEGRVIPKRFYAVRSRPDSLQWEMLRCVGGSADEAQEEPLLACIDAIVGDAWKGTATELLEQIRAIDPACAYLPNTLTRKLNSLTRLLRSEKNIVFINNRRTSAQRQISFTREKVEPESKAEDAQTDVQSETPQPAQPEYESESGVFYELADDDPDATIEVFDPPTDVCEYMIPDFEGKEDRT